MVPEEFRNSLVVDYDKSVDELYAEFYREVEKAYMGEMEFVRSSEEERVEAEKLEREALYRGGW
jgi:hypothetical protein